MPTNIQFAVRETEPYPEKYRNLKVDFEDFWKAMRIFSTWSTNIVKPYITTNLGI